MSYKNKIIKVMYGIESHKPDIKTDIMKFVNISTGNYEPPAYIVAYLFLSILEFKNYGQMVKKVWWHTYFKYRKHIFIIRDYKFGTWSLEALKEDKQALTFISEIIGKIKSACRYVDNILQKEFRPYIEKGNFYINNGYGKLIDTYSFYCDEAHIALDNLTKFKNKSKINENDFKKITDICNERIRLDRLITFRMFPVIITFYSLLEFILDVFYAFIQPKMTFFEYRRKTWQDRFKSVINITPGQKITLYYDKIVNIKRNFRTPLIHGLTNESSLLLPFTFAGLVPISYEHLSNKMHFSYSQISSADAVDILKVFEDILKYFATTKPICYYMLFIEFGFSIPISLSVVKKHKKEMTNMDNFKKYLEDMSLYQDALTNRDI